MENIEFFIETMKANSDKIKDEKINNYFKISLINSF
jgi:hypothetical protein